MISRLVQRNPFRLRRNQSPPADNESRRTQAKPEGQVELTIPSEIVTAAEPPGAVKPKTRARSRKPKAMAEVDT